VVFTGGEDLDGVITGEGEPQVGVLKLPSVREAGLLSGEDSIVMAGVVEGSVNGIR
jgi:hypothetical protein